ncbi:hypothetical protein CXG81DRAFT_16325 [Caulochytrium protostelioides]|uniref:Uncharacterized protein n=1 Tax=Caulochytrium protostelioides TaxID=1555241 RepID=A0A4P9XF60_9FUNG|nr:hypothetical protein CXG81DRAFT_16325 [Caulochytrium protostelioides]|eukprot:RKP04178.1 hypothetical protein CXG81DRAFT_16325 [Caulochytrium protostelioides]
MAINAILLNDVKTHDFEPSEPVERSEGHVNTDDIPDSQFLRKASSQSLDLFAKVKKYAEERKMEPKAQEILDIFESLGKSLDAIPEFEQKVVVAAFSSLRRRRYVLNINHLPNLMSYLTYKGKYRRPTLGFSDMEPLETTLSKLQGNRDTYIEQFHKHRDLFRELVSKSPYSHISLPIKDIPDPSNALQNPWWYDLHQQFPDNLQSVKQAGKTHSSRSEAVRSFHGAEVATHIPL